MKKVLAVLLLSGVFFIPGMNSNGLLSAKDNFVYLQELRYERVNIDGIWYMYVWDGDTLVNSYVIDDDE